MPYRSCHGNGIGFVAADGQGELAGLSAHWLLLSRPRWYGIGIFYKQIIIQNNKFVNKNIDKRAPRWGAPKS